MNLPINKIICGDTLQTLKTFPDECISMVLTSPPYYGLRDYGTATWQGGEASCDHKLPSKIKDYQGDWERPSREEFSKIGVLLKCAVCGEEFKGKKGQKFCSTKCLNTLSNEQRTKAQAEFIKTCSRCGAIRIDKQLGLESTPEEYIAKMKAIMLEIKRMLRKDGTVWWNMGDTYSGGGGGNYGSGLSVASDHKQHITNIRNKPAFIKKYPAKNLMMMPERFAFMMLDIGFTLRNKIIWQKPNPMPSSVKDRFTTTWEYVYLFSKSKKYYFDLDAVRKPHKKSTFNRVKYKKDSRSRENPFVLSHQWSQERKLNPLGKNPGDVLKDWGDQSKGGGTPEKLKHGFSLREFYEQGHAEFRYYRHPLGKNPGDFWSITTQPFKGAHFAVFPEKLCETPIKAGCPKAICNKCGKPRVRIIEKGELIPVNPRGKSTAGPKYNKFDQVGWDETWKPGYAYQNKTIGFTDCGCKVGFSPGIVLDPFAGSGTACLVAKKLGRNYIGIDLKPEYCEMARARLNKIPQRLEKFIAA